MYCASSMGYDVPCCIFGYGISGCSIFGCRGSDKTDGMDSPTSRVVPDHGENPHTRIRVAEELPRTDMAIVLVICRYTDVA